MNTVWCLAPVHGSSYWSVLNRLPELQRLDIKWQFSNHVCSVPVGMTSLRHGADQLYHTESSGEYHKLMHLRAGR